MRRLDGVWRSLDERVAGGHLPGYVAAVRHDGRVHRRALGALAFGDPAPMHEHTQFRIASLSKPVAGALAGTLVRDGVIGVRDDVERWLPEFAGHRVLREPGGALTDTVAASRPMTVRDLLTMTCGIGGLWDESPLARAMRQQGVAPGPVPPQLSADDYVARLAALPSAHQPGDRWLYHTSTELLGVLMARAAGTSLRRLLHDRITGPLAMASTAFTGDPDRLATCYRDGPDGPQVVDPPDGVFAAAPRFESLGTGLVSTVPDYLAFLTALADRDLLDTGYLAAMTTDQLTEAQRVDAAAILGSGASWGFQLSVDIRARHPWMTPGRFGWNGGTGTTGYVDRARDLIAVVFTQRMFDGPQGSFDEFWRDLDAATG